MKFEIIDPKSPEPEEEKPLRVWLEHGCSGELKLRCGTPDGRMWVILEIDAAGVLRRGNFLPPELGGLRIYEGRIGLAE